MYLHISRTLDAHTHAASDNTIVRLVSTPEGQLQVHPNDTLPSWVDRVDLACALRSVAVGRLPPTGDVRYQIRDRVDLRCVPGRPGYITALAAARALLRGEVVWACHYDHGDVTLGPQQTATGGVRGYAACNKRGDVLWTGDAFDVVWQTYGLLRLSASAQERVEHHELLFDIMASRSTPSPPRRSTPRGR